MKKLVVATFLALLLLPQGALAQGASKESVLQYMELTNADRGIDQIGAVVFQQLTNQLRTQNPAITEDTLRSVGEAIRAVLYDNLDQYREAVAASLQAVFTEEEMQAVNAFYSSELGQSFNAKRGQIAQAGAATNREWITSIQVELNQAVQQALGQ